MRLTPDRVVRDIVLCSWAWHLTLTVPLSTQVYKWVPTNLMLGVTLRWTSILSRGEQKYPQSLHATETGISSSLVMVRNTAHMQTSMILIVHYCNVLYLVTVEPWFTKQMRFFASILVKYMEKVNLNGMKPCYSEHIMPFPGPFIKSRFPCVLRILICSNCFCLSLLCMQIHTPRHDTLSLR